MYLWKIQIIDVNRCIYIHKDLLYCLALSTIREYDSGILPNYTPAQYPLRTESTSIAHVLTGQFSCANCIEVQSHVIIHIQRLSFQ